MQTVKELEELKNSLQSGFEYLNTKIENDLPELLSETILQNCKVDGAIEVNKTYLKGCLEAMRADILSAINQQDRREQVTLNTELTQVNNNNSSDRFKIFTWSNGKMSHVPEDFTFPRCSIKIIWDYWYFGDANAAICPFICLDSKDIPPVVNGKKNPDCAQLCRAKKAIGKITEIAIEEKLISKAGDIKKFTRQRSDELFDKCFRKVLDIYSNGEDWESRRINEISYGTVYNQINNHSSNIKKTRMRVRNEVDV